MAVSSFALPLRHTSIVTFEPGFSCATSGGRSDEREMSLPSNLRITSPGSIPAFAAGAVLRHGAHERAAGRLQAEVVGERLAHFLDRHAEAAVAHLAVLLDLVLDVHRDVDRHREREALVAAQRLKICELTPITSPLRLNSGPPELPGFTAASVWMNGTAASPGSERALALTMPEVTVFSRPNGAPIATTHSPTRVVVRIADPDHRQVLRVDLDHRDVGRLVRAQHLRLELALVDELHRHFVGVVDDVRVGEDHAVGVDDEAGAQPLATGPATAAAAIGKPRN